MSAPGATVAGTGINLCASRAEKGCGVFLAVQSPPPYLQVLGSSKKGEASSEPPWPEIQTQLESHSGGFGGRGAASGGTAEAAGDVTQPAELRPKFSSALGPWARAPSGWVLAGRCPLSGRHRNQSGEAPLILTLAPHRTGPRGEEATPRHTGFPGGPGRPPAPTKQENGKCERSRGRDGGNMEEEARSQKRGGSCPAPARAGQGTFSSRTAPDTHQADSRESRPPAAPRPSLSAPPAPGKGALLTAAEPASAPRQTPRPFGCHEPPPPVSPSLQRPTQSGLGHPGFLSPVVLLHWDHPQAVLGDGSPGVRTPPQGGADASVTTSRHTPPTWRP